jgi:hypothetical protein
MVVVKRVEACTKQSPLGCIADDGADGVKTDCGLGVSEVVNGSKLLKVLKCHVEFSRYDKESNP